MRLPVVIVMQSAQHWARDELSTLLWLSPWHWLARDCLPNPLVGPGAVEVRLVLLHYAMQVSLAEDQQVVQAFSTHAAQKSLADPMFLSNENASTF